VQVARRISATVAAAVALALLLGLVSGPAGAVDPPDPTPNQRFVQQLFLDFYGRAGTTNEVDVNASALDAGQLTRVEAGIASSRSYAYALQLVNGFYENTLGRDPDGGGQAYWTGQIWNDQRSVANVAANIYASDEWYASVGDTNVDWLTALYDRLLHRAPDAGGLAYWQQQLVTQGRVRVATVFYQTDESLRTRTAALYELLLKRVPDPGGLTYWSSQVLARGDRTVAGMLAGSQEYFDRLNPPAPIPSGAMASAA
jgi:hypothetical protein